MDLTETLEFKIDEIENAKEIIKGSRSRHPIKQNLLESMETHIDVLKAIIPHTRQVELPEDVQIYTTPIDDLDHVLLGKILDVLSDADEIPILKEEGNDSR